MSKTVRWIVASLIFILFVGWIEIKFSWHAIFSEWRGVSVAALCLITLFTFLSYLLRAYRVYFYFGRHLGQSFLAYIRISLLHNAWNNFLPMRLGEASFPLQMKYEFGVSLLKSGAGLLWVRLMDLHFLMILLTIALGVQWHSLFFLCAVAVIVFPFLLTGLYESRFIAGVEPFNKILKKLREYAPRSYRQASVLYGLTMLVWLVKLSALVAITLSFLPLPFFTGSIAVIVADLSSVLPIHGLAGSGTYEGAMWIALAPFEVAFDSVIKVAVNVHIYILATTLLSVPVALLIGKRQARYAKAVAAQKK